jgi:1,4-alpha-glucan branching enzyme
MTNSPPPAATPASSPSWRTGMGAIPYEGGVAFRVWAPNAESVFVTGSFNEWSATANPLASEGDGYWSADVAQARTGDEYKFVITNGVARWKMDPCARRVTKSNGNSVVYNPDFDWGTAEYQTPAPSELVIYELHTGTFNDSPGSEPGNFDGIINKLDYLSDLGINAIEVMPSLEFASDFSWGYNPANIFAIESAYGGSTAFRHLVRAAHDRGIAVIFDVIYNHFGLSDLDLWQFDGWSENDKGGIYFYNDRRSATPWGDTRPNYGRAEVRRFIRDNVLMWLEEYRVDGLRWDATAYIRNVDGNNDDPQNDIGNGWWLMQLINDTTDARQPWKFNIAEDLKGNQWITKHTAEGGAGFDAQWDGGFVYSVRDCLTASDDGARDMNRVLGAILHRFNADAFERVIYTESHDEVANGQARLPQAISPDDPGNWFARKRSTLGAALVFTSPGIPMIFQGQEILEDEWFRDQNPIDWEKLARYTGIHSLYRDLIRLRRNWHSNTRGLCGQNTNVYHVNNNDKIIAFHRWDKGGPGDDVIVVANFANRSYTSYSLGFPREGQWKVRLNSDSSDYSPDFSDHPSNDVTANPAEQNGMKFSGDVGLGPYSVIILSEDN